MTISPRLPGALLVGGWILALATNAIADEPAPEAEVARTPCCAQLAELSYQPLPADRTEVIEIGERSQLYQFDTGQSFVAALALPEVDPPYRLRVRSYALGDHVQRSRVFYPAAVLLDASHEVVARLEPGELGLVKASFGDTTRENRWGLPLRLEWEIPIDDPAVRYLVLHTTDSALAGYSWASTRGAIPIVLPGMVGALPGKKYYVEVAHSRDGRLAVSLVRDPVSDR